MHKELSVKIRVRGDFHARFCERVRVKLPRSTRPMILLNTEAGDTECIFFKFSEDTAVLHKVKTLQRRVSKPVTVIPRGFMPK